MSRIEVDIVQLSSDAARLKEHLERVEALRASEPDSIKAEGDELTQALTGYVSCISFAADTYRQASEDVRDIINRIQIG